MPARGSPPFPSVLREADDGPTPFSKRRLAKERHLFEQRAALSFTPTTNIPSRYVGDGVLDITVTLAIPTWAEFRHNPAHRVPRLWLDLIQRATNRIRWKPMRPATVALFTWDICLYPLGDLVYKALLDALKETTAGRRDGRLLHYFGAIRDDNARDLRGTDLFHGIVATAADARTRIVVRHVSEDTPTRNVMGYLPRDRRS